MSWSCVEIDAAGNVVPGFSDGLNGGVTMPIGTFVRCEAVNETAFMSLVKEVINDSGGTAVPANWQLTGHASRSRGPGSGPSDGHGLQRLQPRSRSGLARPTSSVRPDRRATHRCRSCARSRTPSPRLTTSITLNLNELAVCVFLNDDQPGQLTLVKEVDNGTTGATATATDWTLSASGPTPISGTSGSATVTDAEVNAGTYTLAESGGPIGVHSRRRGRAPARQRAALRSPSRPVVT